MGNKILVVIYAERLDIQWDKYIVKHDINLAYYVSYIKELLARYIDNYIDYTDKYVEYIENDKQCITIYEKNKSILYDILFDITSGTDCEVI